MTRPQGMIPENRLGAVSSPAVRLYHVGKVNGKKEAIMTRQRLRRGLMRAWIIASIVWLGLIFVILDGGKNSVITMSPLPAEPLIERPIPSSRTVSLAEVQALADPKSAWSQWGKWDSAVSEQRASRDSLVLIAFAGFGIPALVLLGGFAVTWIYRGFLTAA